MTPTPRIGSRGAALALSGIAALGLAAAAIASQAPQPAGHAHGATATSTTHHAQEPVDAAATALIEQTTSAISRYAEVAAAEADGYRWIGDGASGGYRHYIQPSLMLDDDVLDPAHVESLVYRTTADGTLQLVSAMYILPPGSGMDDAPAVAGAQWHTHENLCFTDRGQIAGTNDSGSCPEGSFHAGTPPMLHVWVVETPEGPFAAIDETGAVGTHQD